jgi:invasion protein IalB
MRATSWITAALIAIATSGVVMAEDIPELTVQTEWRKFCFNSQETYFRRICDTRAELRKQDDNSLLVAVDILDHEGGAKKILRVAFPLGMQLRYGTRLIVHGNDPLQGPYVVCIATGCLSDYEASSVLLESMKASQALIVQAIDQSAKPFTATLSLANFWAAHEGPPAEPAVEQIMEPRKSPRKPWLDDTLRPELRPRER